MALLLLILQGISLLLWWIAGSYFGIDVYASRVFPGDDGWCNSALEGLGVHCWGDYYHPAIQASQADPFAGDLLAPYSGAGLLPFFVLNQASIFFGVARLGLVIYLVVMSFTIVYSVWLATKGNSKETRLLLTCVLTLFSPGVLFVLDRGNSTGFVIPALIWLFHLVRTGRSRDLIFAIALLAAIKPHFAVLALVLILVGKPKEGIYSALLSAFINIIPFAVIWPSTFPNNVINWMYSILGFQSAYGTVAAPWPQNVSFSQFIYGLFYGINSIIEEQLVSTLNFVERFQGVIGVVVLLLVLMLILWLRKTLTMTHLFILGVSAISFTPAVSFYYYTVVAIPFLLALQAQELDSNQPTESRKSSKEFFALEFSSVNAALLVASIATLIQTPIPGLTEGHLSLGSGIFVGGYWLAAYLAIALICVKQAMQDAYSRKRNPKYPPSF